ncbi:MAG: acyl carrier protein [Thermoguttaceae bacterium]
MDEQLKQAIANELNVAPAELTSDKPLADLEFWDSVMVLTIMVLVGDAVGSEIGPEEMLGLQTFGDIEKLVASKKP